jgi:acyl-CoA hydrolase
MYVVTEFGMTNLKGKSVAERAKALIELAHPEFREGLERQAFEHGLLPRWASANRGIRSSDTPGGS